MVRVILILTIFILSAYANVAKVIAIKGDAYIKDGTLKLKINTQIKKEDVITTSKNAKLQLLFIDDTIITIGRKSEFKVNEFSFDEEKKDYKASFSLLKGTFRTITGQIGKIAPDKFKLKTKTSSIGIRGTQLLVQIDSQETQTGETTSNIQEKIFCTEGEIIVISLKDGSQYILAAGESINLQANSQTPAIKKKFDLKNVKDVDGQTKFKAEEQKELTQITQNIKTNDITPTVTVADIGVAVNINIEDIASIETLVEEATIEIHAPGYLSGVGSYLLALSSSGLIFDFNGIVDLNVGLTNVQTNYAGSPNTYNISPTGTYTRVTNAGDLTDFPSDIGWGAWNVSNVGSGNWVYGDLTNASYIQNKINSNVSASYTGNLLTGTDSAGTISLNINFGSGDITSDLSLSNGTAYAINGNDDDLSNGYVINDGGNKLIGSFYKSDVSITGGAYKAGSEEGVFMAISEDLQPD